ncbi:MAG: putative sulfate exporter family transporter [Clostridiaceae bacterium]|nr:putative sulfate exporter family transporter [Clostridiaceae bacterium]
MDKIKRILPGFIVSVALGIISMLIGNIFPQIGAATIAIFLGMLVGNLFLHQKIFQPGYKFSETNLLNYSIVLLGATLSVSTLMELGINGIMFIVIQMAITITWAIFIGRKLGFGKNFTYLMAAGNGVCGSSAIGAVVPVVEADEEDKGIAITIVNVTGIVLMFLLPVLSGFLYNHSEMQTSALIGGTLQSVGQVVASGAMVNESVKDLSTIFKIVRVIFLIVVVLVLGELRNRDVAGEAHNGEKPKRKVKIPWYVIGFFITCALFSIGIINEPVSHAAKFVSNKFEVIALAAIGLKVNIKDLVKQGKKVTIYGICIGTMQILSAVTLIWLLIK